MRVKSAVLALYATAVVTVLGAPAYADVLINQPGGIVQNTIQDHQNSVTLNLPGVSLSAMLGQIAVANLNDVGIGPYYETSIDPLNPFLLPNLSTFYLGLGSDYTITQQAGALSDGLPVPIQPAATVIQNALNTISVSNGAQPALSNVIAGGFQQAATTVNAAYFNPLDGTTGTLVQSIANATTRAENVMSATVNNGNASIIGNNGVNPQTGLPVDGFQQAFAFLQTGGVLENGNTANLTLVQKLLNESTITAWNSAIANSIASTSGSLDPSIHTLHQTSVVGVNQMDFRAPTTGNPPVAVQSNINLAGFQPGTLTPDGSGELGLTATIGNIAVAYTGATVAGNNYNVGDPATLGDGIAIVSGVTQNTVFGLNNITGGAGAGLTLSGVLPANYAASPPAFTGLPSSFGVAGVYDPTSDGFLQYVDTSTYALKTLYDVDTQNAPAGANLVGVVNLIGARVNNGSASITGSASALTQSFTNNLNSLQVGGTLSGKATQAVIGINQGSFGGTTPQTSYTGYVNLAVANANSGPASLTNVSQSMNQALNTVAAAQGVDFNLNQGVATAGALAPGLTLSGNNIQVAAGSSATITGALQSIRSTVNVASIGALSGNSQINQASNGINIGGSNQLLALPTNNNATISGIQVNTSSINAVQ